MMVTAFALFALLDATAKYLVDHVGTGLVVFARYGFATLLVVLLIWRHGGLRQLHTAHLGLQLVRGLLLLSATGANFVAVSYLRLDQTASIMFSNPIWVCALSPILLGERVGPRRWTAVIVGFLGVLIIIQPGTTSFHPAMLLSVSVALSTALYQIATRKVGARDSAVISVFYATTVGAVAAIPLAPLNWVTPGPAALALLLSLGIYGAIGHYLLAQAHRLAPAPVLAPFVYLQIVWMSLAGYLIFGDVPDRSTALGATLVILSGLYVYYRERALAQAA
jgi:drug/metabolite transporter (DMT)-like permease